MKKILKEQTSVSDDEKKLRQAYKSGCLPKWLQNGKLGDYEGKKVIYGTAGGDTFVFFSNLTVKNVTTGTIRKWACDTLTKLPNEIMGMFNVTPDNVESVKKITEDLQNEYINNGYVSDIFAKWNQMLKSNFPDVTLLTPKSNTEPFDLPMDKRELTSGKYEPVNSDFFKTKYGWNNVSMYKLKASETDTNLANIKTDETSCKAALVKYLGAAIAYEAQINTSQNRDILNSKVFIRRCFGNGNYDAFEGVDKDTLEADYVKVGKSFTPFGGGFLGRLSKMGKKLSVFSVWAGKEYLLDESKSPM